MEGGENENILKIERKKPYLKEKECDKIYIPGIGRPKDLPTNIEISCGVFP